MSLVLAMSITFSEPIMVIVGIADGFVVGSKDGVVVGDVLGVRVG